MGKEVDFVSALHRRTSRDYVGRVTEHDKAECATIAKRWGAEYWDGARQYGYGGYRYDARWRPVAERLVEHYRLAAGQRVLDVGCGKAHLLYELAQLVPGLEVVGIDISEYGLLHAKQELKGALVRGSAAALPFEQASFDCVISLATLHNLPIDLLFAALSEIRRVARSDRNWVMVESYRNEREKANLLYWQLTCEAFFTPQEWQWIFDRSGYVGDRGFIYFE
jgi:ubiquinone/menaquinone biosynthesis C-methylase UbiE